MVAWLSMGITVTLAIVGGIAAMVKMLYGIDKRLAVIEAVVGEDVQQARADIVKLENRVRALELAMAAHHMAQKGVPAAEE